MTENQKRRKRAVTGPGPITGGRHYLRLQQKLQLDLGDYQALMGITVKEHYLMTLIPRHRSAIRGCACMSACWTSTPNCWPPGPDVIELIHTVKRLRATIPT